MLTNLIKTNKIEINKICKSGEVLINNPNCRFIKIIYKYDHSSSDKYIAAILSPNDYVRNSINGSIIYQENPNRVMISQSEIYITNIELIH